MLPKKLARRVLQSLPPSVIRAAGRLQFRYPALGKILRRVSSSALAGEGTILRGLGAGVKFDPTGGFPGMILGTTEPEEQALVGKHLRSGGVFYDIGANIGFYATVAGKVVGQEGRVYAFEPHPETAQRCLANARRNNFNHVEVTIAAVSSYDGSTKLTLGDGSTQNTISVKEEQGLTVKVVSIDQWRKETQARLPSVVLIDAEGQEIEVLKGMRETIAAARPVLMIEVHWLGEAFANFVQDELVPLGYDFTTYDGGPLKREICRFHALGVPK